MLICLSAVGFASAADNTTDAVGAEDMSTNAISTDENEEVTLKDEYEENLLKVENDGSKLAANPAKLSQLRNDILNNPNSVINLTCDYEFDRDSGDSFDGYVATDNVDDLGDYAGSQYDDGGYAGSNYQDDGGWAGSQYEDGGYAGSNYQDDGGWAGSQYNETLENQTAQNATAIAAGEATNATANMTANATSAHTMLATGNPVLLLLGVSAVLGGAAVLRRK